MGVVPLLPPRPRRRRRKPAELVRLPDRRDVRGDSLTRFQPLVLCYHALSDTWEHALAVRERAFERQIRTVVARGYRPASAAEVLAGRGRVVHVTFDDAYASLERGLPLLERLGLRTTVFACSGFADEGAPLVIPELATQPRDELATLDWDALRALAERGVEIGAHTVTHAHLPALDDAQLDRELSESRSRVEDELRRPCRFMAYPYGEHDERVRAAARRAGYDGAFALHAPARPADPFALPRIDIYRRDNVARVVAKTSRGGRRLVLR